MKKLLLVIPLVILLCFAFSCQNQEVMAELEEFRAQAEVEEQNKALVQKLIEEVDKGNFSIIDELYAPDFEYYGPSNAEPRNLEECKQFLVPIFTALQPKHTLDDFILEGDKVVTRETLYATHKEELFGIPPTGKDIEWSAIAIYQIVDSKIKKIWVDSDMLGIMQQLGMELKPKEGEK
jgi:predicted ester cyclase